MGRCTRYFRLIINVLYIKRGKSVPPSIKTFAKKCTCNPDITKWALHFLELNAKHAQVDNNDLKKKEFSHNSSTRHPQRCKLLWLLRLQRWFISKHSSPAHHQNFCILLRMWIIHARFTYHPLVTFLGWRVNYLCNLFYIRMIYYLWVMSGWRVKRNESPPQLFDI